MATIKLPMVCAILFAHSYASSGTPSSGHPGLDLRDIDSTSAAGLESPVMENFTFTRPFNPDTPPFTQTFSDWIGVVCLRPDEITEDQCFFEVQGNRTFEWFRCPNPDVSGILVRVSAYLANLLLGIIVMYNPKASTEGVWTQLVTVYSLLISGIIAISTQNLSRFHSGMTVFLVMSPLSIALFIYAILGFLGRNHRLDSILSADRQHLIPRVLVVIFPLIAFALMIFTNKTNDSHFTKPSIISFFVPYVGVAIVIVGIIGIFGPTADQDPTSVGTIIGACTPLILILISVAYAAIKTRKDLAFEFRIQKERSKFWVFWEILQMRYPFVHFCGVFLVPMIYWVIVNELRLWETPDNIWSPTFGQVLAVAVVLKPGWQVMKMIPWASQWFKNLAVIRLFTGRQRGSILPVDSQKESQQQHHEMGSLMSLAKKENGGSTIQSKRTSIGNLEAVTVAER
ncbi:hypothetical protein C8R43DRAFT_1244471 [Mycena crocata]|nr:hypothetical protein C8R43DRAFT_1244471 [Mycena crocata]